MQKLEQMINIYHTAFIIFLVLTILFLIISIFLFFKLNIREIYDMRTGRGARRKIQEMEEINERTGKLREDVAPKNYDTSEYDIMPQSKSEPLQEIKHNVTYQDGGNKTSPVENHPAVEADADAGMENTTLLNDESATTLLNDDSQTTLLSDDSQTTLLSSEIKETKEISNETRELSQTEETTQLEAGAAGEEKEEKTEKPGRFHIEKDVMLIHTDEVL